MKLMMPRTSYKTCFLALVAGFLATLLVSCAAQNTSSSPPAGSNAAQSTPPTSSASAASEGDQPLYLGQDWEQQAMARRGGHRPAGPTASNASTAATANVYALVLGTFTGANHIEAANQMLRDLRTIAPQAAGARVHTTDKGSMVVFGSYTGRDDPNITADEQRLKSITYQGRPVFRRVMIARLDIEAASGQLHPFDLRSARRAHPNVDPLYSLDIAVWIANDDPKLGQQISFDEVKRRAEAYAQQLRAQGVEAYFFHDDVGQKSSVTVGLFDRRAIDPRSQLYSAEVEDWIKRFPQRLANGEPLNEFIDKYKPEKGVQPQKPRLVLVP